MLVSKTLAPIKNPIRRLYSNARFIITEVSWHRRVIPLSRGRSIRGWHPVREGHGSVPFESLLERNAISAFAKFPGVRITSQPLTVFYTVDGEKHRYTPDLLIELPDSGHEVEWLGYGQRFFVECKPAARISGAADVLERNFRATQIATGMEIHLMMESDIAAIMEVSHGR